MIKLDKWQEEVLKHRGDMLLSKGRRIGATYLVARKAIDRMIEKRGLNIVTVSLTEDQAELMLTFALDYAKEKCPHLLGKGKDKPTKKGLYLNGGRMIIRPVGNAGDGLRGFTGGILIVDEAPKMPKLFWASATPIILTTGGETWLLGTPFGKQGYFWERYNEVINKGEDNGYKVFRFNTEDVIKNRELSSTWTEEQRKKALEHLDKERKRMSGREFMQEYLGEFIDELLSFFPEELIDKVCTAYKDTIDHNYKFFLGVDVGGLGDDCSTFEIVKKVNKELIVQQDSIITRRTYTTDTIKKIRDLEEDYKFRKIGIDNGGIGAGVFHSLLFEDSIKRKILGLNNASKDLNRDGTKRATLIKEDMYMLLRALMEQGKVRLLNDEKVKHSLMSMQQEIVESADGKKRLRIFGSDSHICEGLVRACWIAKQDKTLNIYAY